MRDANLTLRSTGGLSSSEDGASVDFGGADKGPITYELYAPQATGTTPTLDVKVQESADGSTWHDFLAFKQITAAGQYFVTGLSNERYRRAVFTLGGTTPNFGVVTLYPVFAGRGTQF
ncbi:MAG: hypothetical protein K8R40_02285 [Anaerolineaceae bacterium]|nr:hypothetical protein [Anaerolineaceae bacterium]